MTLSYAQFLQLFNLLYVLLCKTREVRTRHIISRFYHLHGRLKDSFDIPNPHVTDSHSHAQSCAECTCEDFPCDSPATTTRLDALDVADDD